jgi:hypothetical protein
MARKQGDADALRFLDEAYSTYAISNMGDDQQALLFIARELRTRAERLGDEAAAAYRERAALLEDIAAEPNPFYRRERLRPDDFEAQMFADIERQAEAEAAAMRATRQRRNPYDPYENPADEIVAAIDAVEAADDVPMHEALRPTLRRAFGRPVGPSSDWVNFTWHLGNDLYLFEADSDGEYAVLRLLPDGEIEEVEELGSLRALRDFVSRFAQRENPLMLDAIDDPLEPSFKKTATKMGRFALAYHGTSTAAFWPIVTSGLSFEESRKAWEGTSPGVFVAFDQNATEIYASRAVQKFGGKPVCLVLEVPYMWLDIDIDDYLTHDKTRKAQAMVRQPIPPSCIVGVMFAEGMGWGPEIPIKRVIAEAKKGKYVDAGIPPPPKYTRFRTGAAMPIDREHAALNYLVDLLQYTSLADVLLQPEWGTFQRRVLQKLMTMEPPWWLAWRGREWLAFAEEIIGEKNEEPYTEKVLQEPRFQSSIASQMGTYGAGVGIDWDRKYGPMT